MVKKVKNDTNACEDFFELVTTGYIVACAMELLGMSAVDEIPSSGFIKEADEAWMKDDSERRSILMDVAKAIVEQHVDLSTTFSECHSSKLKSTRSISSDSVYAYSCETLSLGLLYLEFKNGVRSGAGCRLMRVWKYFLLLFKAAGRKNYAIEALTLLPQYQLILPPRLAEQLKWSRFINTHGLPGHNISCDLHIEHLNRLAKTAIQGLGANKSEKAIQRVGKAIGTLTDTLENFDKVNNVPAESGAHSTRSSEKDLHKIIKQLAKSKVFNVTPGRRHKSFANLKTNYIRSVSENKLKEWMVDRYASILLESKV